MTWLTLLLTLVASGLLFLTYCLCAVAASVEGDRR